MMTLEKAKEAAKILTEYYGENRLDMTQSERGAFIKVVNTLDKYSESGDFEITIVEQKPLI